MTRKISLHQAAVPHLVVAFDASNMQGAQTLFSRRCASLDWRQSCRSGEPRLIARSIETWIKVRKPGGTGGDPCSGRLNPPVAGAVRHQLIAPFTVKAKITAEVPATATTQRQLLRRCKSAVKFL